jgi:hypothetical protein
LRKENEKISENDKPQEDKEEAVVENTTVRKPFLIWKTVNTFKLLAKHRKSRPEMRAEKKMHRMAMKMKKTMMGDSAGGDRGDWGDSLLPMLMSMCRRKKKMVELIKRLSCGALQTLRKILQEENISHEKKIKKVVSKKCKA